MNNEVNQLLMIFGSLSITDNNQRIALFNLLRHDFCKLADNYIYFYYDDFVEIRFDDHPDAGLLLDQRLLVELLEYINKYGYRLMVEVLKEHLHNFNEGKIIKVEAMVDYYIGYLESYQII